MRLELTNFTFNLWSHRRIVVNLQVQDGPKYSSKAFCNICQKLQGDKEFKVYSNLESWWSKKSKCKKARLTL